MLRSSNCILTGKTPYELSKLNECPLDPGTVTLTQAARVQICMVTYWALPLKIGRCCRSSVETRHLTILRRQRDDDGQNKLLQINGSKIIRGIYYQSYELNTVLKVEDMDFMVGTNSAEASLKLHLLRLEMQPLYQDVKVCDFALQTERGHEFKLCIYCNYSILFNDLLY